LPPGLISFLVGVQALACAEKEDKLKLELQQSPRISEPEARLRFSGLSRASPSASFNRVLFFAPSCEPVSIFVPNAILFLISPAGWKSAGIWKPARQSGVLA
jgi:hypothetical protein